MRTPPLPTPEESRRLLEHALIDAGLSQTRLAKKLGVTRTAFTNALGEKPKNAFMAYRLRLRAQVHLEKQIWHAQREADELAEIGEWLGVDLLTDKLHKIRRAAWRRGITGPALLHGRLFGFPIFALLIRSCSPQSPTLAAPHYAPAAVAKPTS